ncbi:uncharacterized protein G2W53_026899 [Senna tora]|uniref:Uncharacterized protein n=1 Tax=Senna tora TaxID=362788 RepID=A0A834TPW0_9FABA|nr:uncharacterized protein G2W53_026899 [Senna tora]
MGLVITRKVGQDRTKHKKYMFKRLVAQVSQTDYFALYLVNRVDLKLELGL